MQMNESDDEDYVEPDTKELEEASESSSDKEFIILILLVLIGIYLYNKFKLQTLADSGGEDESVDEENFAVQVKDGEIQKMKFDPLETSSQVRTVLLLYTVALSKYCKGRNEPRKSSGRKATVVGNVVSRATGKRRRR